MRTLVLAMETETVTRMAIEMGMEMATGMQMGMEVKDKEARRGYFLSYQILFAFKILIGYHSILFTYRIKKRFEGVMFHFGLANGTISKSKCYSRARPTFF